MSYRPVGQAETTDKRTDPDGITLSVFKDIVV